MLGRLDCRRLLQAREVLQSKVEDLQMQVKESQAEVTEMANDFKESKIQKEKLRGAKSKAGKAGKPGLQSPPPQKRKGEPLACERDSMTRRRVGPYQYTGPSMPREYDDAASGLQDQLRSLRLRRHTIRKQLSSVAADSSRLFASIDFTRQQIEDLERLVAYLKEARRATAAGLHNEECLSNLRRSGRRKLELQSKHQLVLASYRQAEHDRNDARKALEDERDRLAKLQAARLRLCEERHAAIQEALKLAKGVGLSPLVLKELCGQELASPTVSKVHHEAQEGRAATTRKGDRLVQQSFAGLPDAPPAATTWTSFAGGS
eukprot:s3468_g10.t2